MRSASSGARPTILPSVRDKEGSVSKPVSMALDGSDRHY